MFYPLVSIRASGRPAAARKNVICADIKHASRARGRKKSHFRKVRGPGRRVSGEKIALQMGRVSQGCHGTGRFNIDGASASVFATKNEVTLRNIWYWTSLTTRRDFFSLFSRFLTFCKSNFFLFLNFLIFVSLSLPRTHATGPIIRMKIAREDFSKWSSKRATRTLDSDTAALASWHFQPYKSRSFK